MNAEEILRELSHDEGLPRKALKAASSQRSEMLPLFLNEIETCLASEPAAPAEATLLFFIFHLLGEWREKAAYRPLTRLLRLPGHKVDAIFGDATTLTSHRVMAAVFDGDPQPLYDIILDPSADEFIRAGMCEAMTISTLCGDLDRDVAGRFLRDAFMNLRPQAQNYVWAGWQSAIAMLGISELKSLVKKAFNRGFIDRSVLDFEDFEQDLWQNLAHADEPWCPDNREYALFGDTIDELSGWYCFSEQYHMDRERWRLEAETAYARSLPRENPLKGIGRNDPCPCGSGKKFKRCCLAAVQLGLAGREAALPSLD
jgi:Protein of unknown function (DUF1186)/SEC-C motif